MGLTWAIATALEARIEDGSLGMNLACTMDNPAFARPDLAVASGAVFINFVSDVQDIIARSGDRRMGGRSDGWMTTFRMTVMAKDEPTLYGYVDAARAMFDQWPEATISSVKMGITASTIDRVPVDELTPEVLRYAVQTQITFKYVRV